MADRGRRSPATINSEVPLYCKVANSCDNAVGIVNKVWFLFAGAHDSTCFNLHSFTTCLLFSFQ